MEKDTPQPTPPLSPAVLVGSQLAANGGFPPAAPLIPSPTPVPSPNFSPPPARPSK